MPIYKPSELHQFLESLGINPRKALSQNFLIDGNIIRKIVAEANVSTGETILEIGPGPGSLTEALLHAGCRVIAVEKDPVLAKALERLKGPGLNLEIFCEDILDFSFEERISNLEKKVKIVANLPYHVTTPIISKLVAKRNCINAIIVMVQEEVARRFTALPGNKDYGSFTVFLNYHTNPKYAFGVSRNCFFPVPTVESAVVSLQLKDPPAVSDEAAFFEMTRMAFMHRRKMLRASLKPLFDPQATMSALEGIGKPDTARPEGLSLEDFIHLFERLRSFYLPKRLLNQ